MKLTKEEAKKICKIYGLGEFKRINKIRAGWVNHNFFLKTGGGTYVVQVLSSELDAWRKKRIRFQHKVLRHLKLKNFPYETPEPIRMGKGGYFMGVGGKHLWVYRKIEGENRGKADKKKYQEIAKVLALFHKYTSDVKPLEKDFSDFIKWQKIEFSKMKKVKPKDKVDKLMLKNIDYVEGLFDFYGKMNYGKWIVTHSDIHNENVLVKNGEIVGLIDFDNLGFGPKAKDLSLSIDRTSYLGEGLSDKKIKVFLEGYKKFGKVSSKDEKLIKTYMLFDYCNLFWWIYAGMEKRKSRRYEEMVGLVKGIRKLERELG
jgi:homoserine kinase type II